MKIFSILSLNVRSMELVSFLIISRSFSCFINLWNHKLYFLPDNSNLNYYYIQYDLLPVIGKISSSASFSCPPSSYPRADGGFREGEHKGNFPTWAEYHFFPTYCFSAYSKTKEVQWWKYSRSIPSYFLSVLLSFERVHILFVFIAYFFIKLFAVTFNCIFKCSQPFFSMIS